jgi:hypothetical protein
MVEGKKDSPALEYLFQDRRAYQETEDFNLCDPVPMGWCLTRRGKKHGEKLLPRFSSIVCRRP